MIVTTTPSIEGKRIVEYLGVATGDAIVGVNIFRDIFARIRDIIGGRAGGYEAALSAAKEAAFDDLVDRSEMLGADAIVSVAFEYETVGNSMLMVSISGTAVRLG